MTGSIFIFIPIFSCCVDRERGSFHSFFLPGSSAMRNKTRRNLIIIDLLERQTLEPLCLMLDHFSERAFKTAQLYG